MKLLTVLLIIGLSATAAFAEETKEERIQSLEDVKKFDQIAIALGTGTAAYGAYDYSNGAKLTRDFERILIKDNSYDEALLKKADYLKWRGGHIVRIGFLGVAMGLIGYHATEAKLDALTKPSTTSVTDIAPSKATN